MKGKRLNSTLMAALTALLLINLLATGTFAQTAGGTILGKVTDLTGAILPGVAITIKNRRNRNHKSCSHRRNRCI